MCTVIGLRHTNEFGKLVHRIRFRSQKPGDGFAIVICTNARRWRHLRFVRRIPCTLHRRVNDGHDLIDTKRRRDVLTGAIGGLLRNQIDVVQVDGQLGRMPHVEVALIFALLNATPLLFVLNDQLFIRALYRDQTRLKVVALKLDAFLKLHSSPYRCRIVIGMVVHLLFSCYGPMKNAMIMSAIIANTIRKRESTMARHSQPTVVVTLTRRGGRGGFLPQ